MTATLRATADPALVRERRGWYGYDLASNVFYTVVLTVFLGPNLTSVAKAAADGQGRIHPLGLSMPPGRLFGYLVSVSVVLQVLVMPLTGAIADRTGRKRQLLAGFAGLGALATMALDSVAGGRYLLGPFVFALTFQLSGSYRSAIFSLVFFLLAGGPLLARLPVRPAITAAGNPAPELV